MERHRPRSSPTCPLCREGLTQAPGPLYTCSGCSTAYHEVCLQELGGCSTLGCRLAGRAPAGTVWKDRGRRSERRRRERVPPHQRLAQERRALENMVLWGLAAFVGAALLGFILVKGVKTWDALQLLGIYALVVGSAAFNRRFPSRGGIFDD